VDARRATLADLLPPQRYLAGHSRDSATGPLRDPLDSLGNLSRAVGGVVCPLLLDVQVLRVLAHNDHVDGLGGRHDGLDGAYVGVQVELLAEGDDGRAVALARRGGGADGAEERAIALRLEDLDCLVRESGSGLLEGLEAGFEVDELEFQAQGGGEGFEDAAAGGNDFFADSVAGDETWLIFG
jgi:hypothetical protein